MKTFLLLLLLASTAWAVEKEPAIAFKMVPVRDTGIQFPMLTSYREPNVLKKVNSAIADTTAEFGCDVEEGTATEYAVKSNVAYTLQDIFSIYAAASYYCGGAYPTNDMNISMTFDMKTGDAVYFTDLFQDYDRDQEKILRVIYGPKIEQSEKLEASSKKEEGSCDEDPWIFSLDHLKESSYNFHFAADGLHVQPDWPHVIEACAEISVVPYSKLKPFAAPSSILQRVQNP